MLKDFFTHPTLPIADIMGKQSGATLLVTAGVDGDEYTGIAAAFDVAERYTRGDFSGRLIIIPIVNIAGFEAKKAPNPTDGKFPKYCIPGRRFGSASERLMRFIVKNYAQRAQLWLDLHSGGPHETTLSCIWNDVTGTEVVDLRGHTFSVASGADVVVHEQAGRRSLALAAYGCAYALAESEDEAQHASYVRIAMQILQMIPEPASDKHPKIFNKTRELYASTDEFWDPHAYTAIVSPDELLLWHRVPGPVHRGDRLGEIAYAQQKS